MARPTPAPPPAWMHNQIAAAAHAHQARAEAAALTLAHGQYGPHTEHVFKLHSDAALAAAVAAAPHGEGRMQGNAMGRTALQEHEHRASMATGIEKKHHLAAIATIRSGAASANDPGTGARVHQPGQHHIQQGKHGGSFYLSPTGQKIYVGKSGR